MCAPGVMMAAQAVGAGVNAYSSVKAGEAQGDIADNNAMLAKYQASDALHRGAIQAGAIRQQGFAQTASALAAMGANGVDSGGAPITKSLANTETDYARAVTNAQREAWGFKVEAQNFESDAKRARRAGFLGAAGAGVGLFGSAGSGAANNYAGQVSSGRNMY